MAFGLVMAGGMVLCFHTVTRSTIDDMEDRIEALERELRDKGGRGDNEVSLTEL